MATTAEMGRSLIRRIRDPWVRIAVAALTLAILSLPGFAETHFVIIEGLGGTEEYAEEFREQLEDLRLAARLAVNDDAQVHVLAGKEATRARLQEVLMALGETLTPADALAVVMIGHGSHDGKEYKLNIPGADFTATQLKLWLDAIPAGRQLVVSTTSSSGGAVEALTSERRIVIAATKNGREKNATVFGRYWAEALSNPEADTDKNETISALEAYRYTEDRVKSHFEDAQKLATEHPRIEGELAASFIVARLGSTAAAAADPVKAALLTEREGIERKIDELKLRKDDISEEEYLDALQELLVELAGIQEKILDGLGDKDDLGDKVPQ